VAEVSMIIFVYCPVTEKLTHSSNYSKEQLPPFYWFQQV